MESGELISHGMFGAPDLRIIAICRAGAPFLATDFSKAQFQTAAASSFPGNCVDALDGIGRGGEGCKLSRSSVNCEGGPRVSAGCQQGRIKVLFLHFGKCWQFLSVP
jgi:hypothetical protein